MIVKYTIFFVSNEKLMISWKFCWLFGKWDCNYDIKMFERKIVPNLCTSGGVYGAA